MNWEKEYYQNMNDKRPEFYYPNKILFQGITFTRVSRPATEIVYDNNEVFEIGKAKVLKQSPGDACLVIAAGITLDQALKAVPKLEALGIKVRLMDPFTIKPIDKEAILKHAAECNGKVLVVEDHYSEVRGNHAIPLVF